MVGSVFSASLSTINHKWQELKEYVKLSKEFFLSFLPRHTLQWNPDSNPRKAIHFGYKPATDLSAEARKKKRFNHLVTECIFFFTLSIFNPFDFNALLPSFVPSLFIYVYLFISFIKKKIFLQMIVFLFLFPDCFS